MVWGLQVYNDDQILQVDGTYYNMCLRSKGTVVTSGSAMPYTASVTLACVDPIMAFRCTTDYAYIINQVNNGNGTWTFTLGSVGPSKSIGYYLYDRPSQGPSTYGLQVFNDSGVLVFDSLWPYLLPNEMYQDTNGSMISTPVNLTGEASRLYAIVQNYMGSIQFVGWEDAGGGTSTIYNVAISASTCKFTSGNVANLAYKDIYYKITGNVAYSGGGGTPSYTLIDVTNM